jgi:hypothetical protein
MVIGGYVLTFIGIYRLHAGRWGGAHRARHDRIN